MLKNGLVGLLAAVFMLAGSGQASAQTPSMQQALTRMDEIIAEMQRLRSEFAALQAQINGSTPAPQVQGAQTSTVGFTESLEVGATNDDIAYIQKLLATDPAIYPDGIVSGYYGPKTVEAIRNFQARFGLSTPGVIGPQTQTILEAFLQKYPDGNFPENVLQAIPQVPSPQVQGAATTVTPKPTPTTSVDEDHDISTIFAEISGDEARARVQYESGSYEWLTVDGEDEDEVVAALARELNVSKATIEELIDLEVGRTSQDDDDNEDKDDSDAEEALEDAEDAIDDADNEIDEAEADGEDVDYAKELLDEAEEALEDAEDAYDDEDYDEAVEKAEEAEELANDAEDAIGQTRLDGDYDADDIDEITIEIEDGEAHVEIVFEDDSEEELTIDEDDQDDILAELADELDIDEDDLEDLIEWDFGDIDEIIVRIEDGEARVRVEYESGVRVLFYIDEDDEDEMLEEIADEIDEDEDDIEKLTSFDYF